MKKFTLLIILLFSIAVMLGCYDGNDMATVKINLGGLPVGKRVEKKSFIDRILCFFSSEAIAQGIPVNVTNVYIGVFDKTDQLIANRTVTFEDYPADDVVEFTIPAGDKRRIVVLGELDTGLIDWYGLSDSLDLAAGDVVTVPVTMVALDGTYINLPGTFNPITTWDKVIGATKYNVYNSLGSLLQSGTSRSFTGITLYDMYYVEIEFGFSGKNSDRFSTMYS